jgi:hypothetical protein
MIERARQKSYCLAAEGDEGRKKKGAATFRKSMPSRVPVRAKPAASKVIYYCDTFFSAGGKAPLKGGHELGVCPEYFTGSTKNVTEPWL